jgi:2-polyprenyl-3-methyl-5-hydroxy-6-metoxy-1,4-benzoquinol methylase
VFEPGVIEVRGKWHDATKELSGIIFKNISGKSILDVGCNCGFFLCEAFRSGASTVVGIDNDIVSVNHCKEIIHILNVDATVYHVNAEEYKPDKYDVILLLNILHVISNPVPFIEKYFNAALSTLVIEHEIDHQQFFPNVSYTTFPSPRSYGHRLISIFAKN